ncbi:hypothetical protein [Rhodococcus sp. NPDC004095]
MIFDHEILSAALAAAQAGVHQPLPGTPEDAVRRAITAVEARQAQREADERAHTEWQEAQAQSERDQAIAEVIAERTPTPDRTPIVPPRSVDPITDAERPLSIQGGRTHVNPSAGTNGSNAGERILNHNPNGNAGGFW